ncbi:hypothetical protein ACU4GD_00225 [Cupriavidus basilensis]
MGATQRSLRAASSVGMHTAGVLPEGDATRRAMRMHRQRFQARRARSGQTLARLRSIVDGTEAPRGPSTRRPMADPVAN